MISRAALLPLDSRPCNTKYPDYISKIAGIDLLLPPKELLGDIKHPGNHERLVRWLENVVPEVDILILSIDMLVFGGLVRSRKHDSSFGEAMSRLKLLSKIRKHNPHLKIYAFSIIMRLSVTAEDKKSAEYCRDIFEYSKIARSSKKDDIKRVDCLRKRIPREVLEDYLKTRQRNHEINRVAVEVLADGDIDHLVLGVEDSSEQGLHEGEKENLQRMIEKRDVSGKAGIVTGADELSSLLICRAKTSESVKRPKVFVKYLDERGARIVSLYEDKSIDEVVTDHIELAGVEACYSDYESDLILFVNTPIKSQPDLFLAKPSKKKVDERIFDEVNNEKVYEKPFAVADVKYCNGADAGFVPQLLKNVDLSRIVSFSGFNTTANSVGIVLAHSISFLLSERNESTLRYHREFLLYSLANDYLYQAVVRPEIIEHLKSEGMSIFDISSGYAEADYLLKEKMVERKEELLDPLLRSGSLELKNIMFPWKRIFEIDMDVKFSV
ncbi:DUF4127 family protein [Candidatus Margulisiibacteriota bacterium]